MSLYLLLLVAIFFCIGDKLKAADNSVTALIKISICGNGEAEGGEDCDNSDLGGETCVSLGFGGGTLSCTSACTFNAIFCTEAQPQVTATSTFSYLAGGDYTLTNENSTTVVFNIPAGFYSENLDFQASSFQKIAFESTMPPPTGEDFVGKVYDFTYADQNGDEVTELLQPVTISLNYEDSDVVGFDEDTIKPYRRESDDSSWTQISDSVLDAINNVVTFSSISFSYFSLIGKTISTPGGGGGGGGGGGTTVQPTISVNFNGRAYPEMTVTLLKDAQVVASTVAGADASFQINVSGLTTGNYIFSLYGEDQKGRRSSLVSFPLSVSAGTTTNINGIFIAPTIAVDKSEVKRGDNLAIFGQSAPNGEVTISVFSDEEIFSKIKADVSGVYLYNLDTSPLAMGQHSAKSKTALKGELSPYSKTVGFQVGTKTVLADRSGESQGFRKGDVNGDNKINLIDFSIVAYWYNRPSPPTNVDLNKDGKVNLVDFSILAYYWTG